MVLQRMPYLFQIQVAVAKRHFRFAPYLNCDLLSLNATSLYVTVGAAMLDASLLALLYVLNGAILRFTPLLAMQFHKACHF